MSQKLRRHPHIVHLLDTDLPVEVDGQPEITQRYTKGWIEGSAMRYYSRAIANFTDGSGPVAVAVDNLCAELGYWRAVADMHRSKEGKRIEGPRFN